MSFTLRSCQLIGAEHGQKRAGTTFWSVFLLGIVSQGETNGGLPPLSSPISEALILKQDGVEVYRCLILRVNLL